jgi:hypothetical protein
MIAAAGFRDRHHTLLKRWRLRGQAVKADTAFVPRAGHTDSMTIMNQANSPMWIPTPIYEALPYLYILGGVLFIAGTLYIGLAATGATLYIGCGLVSIVYGAYVLSKRHAYRSQSPRSEPTETA